MTYMFSIVGELLPIIGVEFVGFMGMFKGSAGALVAVYQLRPKAFEFGEPQAKRTRPLRVLRRSLSS